MGRSVFRGVAAALVVAGAACGERTMTPPSGGGGDDGADRAPEVDANRDSAMDAGDAVTDVRAPTQDTTGDIGPDQTTNAGGPADGAGIGRCAPLRLQATMGIGNVIATDLDGDGRRDIVSAHIDGLSRGHVYVLRQTAPRTFGDPIEHDVGGLYVKGLASFDIDADGAMDIAASDSYGRVGLLLTGGGAGFALTIISGGAQQTLDEVAVGDLDVDGHADVAVPVYSGNRLGIWWGTGAGAVMPRVDQIACTTPTRVRVIDANEDRRPDLVVGCLGGASLVMINQGNRTFMSSGLFGSSSVSGIATGDVNRDGHVDIVLPDRFFQDVIVYLGDGLGQFSVPTGLLAATPPEPNNAALADLDADGQVDLVVGDSGQRQLSFYRGLGDGHFENALAIALPSGTSDLWTGDVDGDGVDDVITSGVGISVFFGPCP